MSVRSKICGIKFPKDLISVASLNPDYMGFIFYPGSVRYMGSTLAPSAMTTIDPAIIRTGVFVNEGADKINEISGLYDLGAVQLHGDESPREVEAIQRRLSGDVQIFKAFGISSSFEWKSLNDYQDCCDVFLFDTKTANYGGSGQKFDHQLLTNYQLDKPVMMSGGIGVDDLPAILEKSDDHLWGIDMNSKLEIEPGKKDIELVKSALNIIKSHEQ